MTYPAGFENEPQFEPRSPLYARPGPIPDIRLEGLMRERVPSLVPRDSSTSSSSGSSNTTTSCGPKDTTGPCERSSSGSNLTLPIVLGVVIPLGIAFVVLVFLHRRHVKRLRREDMEDKNKSLDFGMGSPGPPATAKGRKNKKAVKGPEMSMAETHRAIRSDRGLSLDLTSASPYLLPPGLQHSRESLHSLTRTHTGDDKYRITEFIPDDGSIRAPSSLRRSPDDSSSYTGSSKPKFDGYSSKTLLNDGSSFSSKVTPSAKDEARKPVPPSKDAGLLAPALGDVGRDSFVSTTSDNGNTAALRASNNYLGAYIKGGMPREEAAPKLDTKDPAAKESQVQVQEVNAESPKIEVQPPAPTIVLENERSSNANPESHPDRPISEMPPEREPRLPQLSFIENHGSEQRSQPALQPTDGLVDYHPPSSAGQSEGQDYDEDAYGHQSNGQYCADQYDHDGSQIPQIQTEEYEDDYYDPEEIYGVDEHEDYEAVLGYDPRRLTWGMRPLPPDDPSENPEQRANRIRSFYKEYFDETSRNPNAASQYFDGSDYYDDYYDQDQYYSPRGHSSTAGPHRATVSSGSRIPGPRAFSSASGRYGRFGPGPRPRMPPKKKPMMMPKALNVLPTPHKLKDDTFLIDQAIDFAPPKKAMLQRTGTPDSLRGGTRPYSPTVLAFTPLASSFDDLAVMPSPHQLRKSGTFTALDFAPPPKFRGQGDSMSETGSIRSNRSAMSQRQLYHMRAGAYRISRIPKEVAGTKDELSASLRPKWDMNR